MSSLKVIPWIGRMIVCTVLLAATCLASSRKERVLYSFQGGSDGARPIGGVVFDQAGNLYGATVNGGAHTCRSLDAGSCRTVQR